ncbi:MAG: hypothetical protein ABI036_06615 [Fibrobacteria bacterium]
MEESTMGFIFLTWGIGGRFGDPFPVPTVSPFSFAIAVVAAALQKMKNVPANTLKLEFNRMGASSVAGFPTIRIKAIAGPEPR